MRRSSTGGNFYSRPCGRGDILPQATFVVNSGFLLTPLREGRPDRQRACAVCRSISTHAPAGGATRRKKAMGSVCKNFYSRPCGRGDGRLCDGPDGAVPISTHAPAGGATRWTERTYLDENISTHAPAGGATRMQAGSRRSRFTFLLTPLREGRPGVNKYIYSHTEFLLTPLREGRRQFSTSPS